MNKWTKRALVLPVWLITVSCWAIFTWGVKLQKKIMPEAKVNYWKYNDVLALFMKNDDFYIEDGQKDSINIRVEDVAPHRMKFRIKNNEAGKEFIVPCVTKV